MNAKEFYEFQLNDKTSVVGRQDKDEIIMLMEEYHKYKVKNCNAPAVSKSVSLEGLELLLAYAEWREGFVLLRRQSAASLVDEFISQQ